MQKIQALFVAGICAVLLLIAAALSIRGYCNPSPAALGPCDLYLDLVLQGEPTRAQRRQRVLQAQDQLELLRQSLADLRERANNLHPQHRAQLRHELDAVAAQLQGAQRQLLELGMHTDAQPAGLDAGLLAPPTEESAPWKKSG